MAYKGNDSVGGKGNEGGSGIYESIIEDEDSQ
jgi:hypothetical protein